MEQRPLRLGDIVDDYCPRERRLTNHAIVALVEDTIKQTRCTTCDHEHVYKGGKEPKRRKKDQTAVLYSQVLSGLQKPGVPGGAGEESEPMADEREPTIPAEATEASEGEELSVQPEPDAEPIVAASEDEPAAESDEPEPGNSDDIWPMHRRLIRAQLPRTGNEPPPARPLPEFTVRQPGARGQRQWGRHSGNGNGHHGGHGQGQGQGRGQGQGGGRRNRGGFMPPRPDGRGGPGGRPGGGRGRRSR